MQSFLQRPMVNGILVETQYQNDEEKYRYGCMEFMWDQIGKQLVQMGGIKSQKSYDPGFADCKSRVLMTEPSLTMASGDKKLMRQSEK